LEGAQFGRLDVYRDEDQIIRYNFYSIDSRPGSSKTTSNCLERTRSNERLLISPFPSSGRRLWQVSSRSMEAVDEGLHGGCGARRNDAGWVRGKSMRIMYI